MNSVSTPQKLTSWQMNEWKSLIDSEAAPSSTSGIDRKIVFIISFDNGSPSLSILSTKLKKNGEFAKSNRQYYSWSYPTDRTSQEIRQLMSESDWELMAFITRRMHAPRTSHSLPLEFLQSGEVLKRLVDTGRCYYYKDECIPLKWGAAKPGKLEWNYRLDQEKHQITLQVENSENCLLCTKVNPLCFFDLSTNTFGYIETSEKPQIVKKILAAPPVSRHETARLQELLQEKTPHLAHLAPKPVKEILVEADPKPHVSFVYFEMSVPSTPWQSPRTLAVLGARVSFDYDGWLVSMSSPSRHDEGHSTIQKGQEIGKIKRKFDQELRLVRSLTSLGWADKPPHYNLRCHYVYFEQDSEMMNAAIEIVTTHAQKLKMQGWKVEIDSSFPINEVFEGDDWYLETEEENKNDWFDVKMGVLINGERINLLPVLVQLAETIAKAGTLNQFDALGKENKLRLRTEAGKLILVPVERIKNIINHLLVEFSSKQNGQAIDTIRISKWQTAFLEEVVKGEAAASGRWVSPEKLGNMTAHKLEEVTTPAGLQCTLRPYQKEGLNWMQYLCRCGMNGILADDMGLGKTVQALSHILVEKESGRMTLPVIVIAPTSLMPNWFNEAGRFAPSLKVLVLHGDERRAHFSKVHEYDLILTTYPLLMRDKEFLLQHTFHLMILDEAQALKNFKTQSYQVVQQIRAGHTICLSGTPMENHLGELWSLFHLLLPGFLGDQKTFQAVYKKPIETLQNDQRKQSLATRIKPFILRRTKQQVAIELPAKTEVIQKIELKEKQRDLYEAIRLRAQEKVMAQIREKGIEKSQIIVLDALLKLRQVCCDPRLVKMKGASEIGESAKLEFLMEMLSQMVEENKKVLIFSQFSSMLEIIAKTLTEQSITYTMLTGDTKDRETPVSQFQIGNASVMLISLKAGGVGLNLTAADTVIHYDPWWNPAAESQATDRAHRIGQTKPVFVYKLVVSGSLEEKIIALQERKKGLVQALMDPASSMGAKLSLEDLESIFQPLPQPI